MKEQQEKQQYIENCKALIELIGRKQIRTECEITLQNLDYWIKHGIPRAWINFLREKYKEEAKQVFQGKV